MFLGIKEFGRKNLYYNNAVYELILTFIAYMTMIFILKYKKFNIKDEVRKKYIFINKFCSSIIINCISTNKSASCRYGNTILNDNYNLCARKIIS